MNRQQVTAVLERGRPFLRADGGDIELIDLHGASATVRVTGACGSCPTAFELSVEAALRSEMPELDSLSVIRGVRS
jgi:Fe-S cluster biogenesis protein NfuA